ncbi:MAG: DUF106 domain-containing protein [Halobacteriaceae archaeon]
MARTAETVQELILEDEEMEDVLEYVLEVGGDGSTELEWGDVRDELTSGQWGRLIETGILEDAEEGFVVADPEGLRDGLEGPDIGELETEIPDKDTSWSRRDKLAGVLTLFLIPAYMVPQIRSLVGGAVNVLLGPLLDVLPFYAVILLLAVVTGLYSALLQDAMIDMDVIAAYQKRMQEVQDLQDKAKESGDDEAVQAARERQMEAMGENTGMFKEQFRPFVYIMLLTIPAFVWMYWIMLTDAGPALEPMTLALIGEREVQDAVIGPIQAWIFWYFLCSMGFSNIVRKSLDVQTSPNT